MRRSAVTGTFERERDGDFGTGRTNDQGEQALLHENDLGSVRINAGEEIDDRIGIVEDADERHGFQGFRGQTQRMEGLADGDDLVLRFELLPNAHPYLDGVTAAQAITDERERKVGEEMALDDGGEDML